MADVDDLLKSGDQAEKSQYAADDRKEKTDSTQQKPPTNHPVLFLVEINMVLLRRDPPPRRKPASWPQNLVEAQVIVKTGRYSFDYPQHQKPEAGFGEENGWDQVIQGSENQQERNAENDKRDLQHEP